MSPKEEVRASLSPLTQSHVLMNKAQAALWLIQAGWDDKTVANVVGLPGLNAGSSNLAQHWPQWGAQEGK